jgi:hypothetical protein
MVEILVIQKPLNNHIKFEWKFKFLIKNYESACWHGGNSSYLVAIRWVLFPNMLSLVLNSTSCWKFMQLHEKMVEMCPIWWPLDGFYFLARWFWCQIQLLLNFFVTTWKDGWNTSYLVVIRCGLPSLMNWIKSRIKVKV